MAEKPKKQAAKGQKQIHEENKAVIRFYTYMASIAMAVYVSVMLIFFSDLLFTFKYLFATFSCASIYFGSISMLKYMARPILSQTNQVVDGGTDLNMEKGFAENFKDLIILTSIVQLISLYTNYAYLLLLFVPGRAAYMLWVNVLGPWFFAQPSEEQEQVDEKKQRKLERRMRRVQH